jgi:hypothetical protein
LEGPKLKDLARPSPTLHGPIRRAGRREETASTRGADREDLAKQGGFANRRQGKDVAADGRFRDRVPQVSDQTLLIVAEPEGAGIGARPDDRADSLLERNPERVRQRASGPVSEDEPLEAPRQRLSGALSQVKRGRSRCNDLHSNPTPAKAVPFPLQAGRPVRQVLDFVEKENGRIGAAPPLRLRPGTFEGPKLKGTVVAPTGDLITVRQDGSSVLDLRLLLQTTAGRS